MIGKARKGNDFARLAAYLTRDGRGRLLALDNLASDGPQAAAAEMSVQAATSRRTTQPVMHLSISYGEGEDPTPDQMRADARRTLQALGLDRNQAVIIAHDDTENPHLHIMVNRVGTDGKAVSDSNSYARIEDTLRGIENERGWAAVEGRHAPAPETGARKKGHRHSADPHQHHAPAGVRNTLLQAGSWKDLHRDLHKQGWKLEIVQRGRGSGALLIGPDGQRIGAGKIDRNASLTSLRRRLGRDPEARRKAYTKTARREFRKAAGAALSGAVAPFLGPGFQPSTPRPGKRPRRGPGAPRM